MNWDLLKIEEFADVIGGGTPSTKNSDYWNGDIPWIGPRDLSGWDFKFIENGARNISDEGLKKSSTKLLPKNTVLMTSRAPIGYVAISKNKICTNQGFQNLVCKENISDPNFVYYLIKENIDKIKSVASGATFPEISKTKLKGIELSLPPLQTQKRIADILSAYDDLIENNLKRIKLLEQAAQNIYKEWFVNLRFPGYENTHINEETGLPVGWEEKALGEFTEIKKGKNITRSTIKEGNVPVVAGGLKPAYYHNTSNTSNPVITVSASGANAGYVNMYLEDIWASDCSYIDSNLSDSVFFIHNLLLNQQELIFGMQRGAAQPHVYPKDLKRAEFVIPDKGLIQKFEEQVSAQYDMKRVLLNQNQKLKAARDILLPRLMNRTIEV
jgi:type I restriction enzyme S subunit